MTWETALAFNVTLLVAWIVPGPAALVAIRTTLAEGRGAGALTGAGLAVAASLWTAAALMGLEAVLAVAPWAGMALRVGGALYLVWIAWGTWRGARDPLPEGGVAGAGRRAFLRGALVNLGNPKSILFAAAVLVVIFPPGLSGAEKTLVVANHLALEAALYALLALVMGTAPVRRAYLGAKLWIDRGAAVVLGGLGLRLLVR
ncbi:LysE family translocator [Jannaschia sp. Os4]|uniref:LysE family translocator n=1 Tax=Jannaschia sp. Os4 TaxID=2807617 RepID=UPI00193AB1F3|nr:LysE family translocator [Jannaschia sp. Os4]MBM2576685.1 LysE family translocator [Jannaschia sp. Os4]